MVPFRAFFRFVLFAAFGVCGLLAGVSTHPAGAQGLGRLRFGAEMFGVAGTAERLPFWLAGNQYGTVDPVSATAGLRIGAHRPFEDKSGFDYAVGAELLGRASQSGTVTIHQLYGPDLRHPASPGN
ncbi:hypothetical protein [Salinibacter sp.]|uniref:hypothetical protein n=1 Tax=Salinibacter sp. TaxID=2065818 RepID=UPI0021E97F40|nr:hypothetical protein [Salinibacter sp.]